jgi:hypothetical protein
MCQSLYVSINIVGTRDVREVKTAIEKFPH